MTMDDREKTLFIRADATTQIGTGHVMRCIALAHAWQDKGGKVIFLSHCKSQALQNRIIDEGFDLTPIENPHPHQSDLKQTLDILNRSALCALPSVPIWLVLDGYHFTPKYHKAIKGAGYRLLVLDDMNHLPHYHADIILNQNINAEHLHYACERDTRLLLGTKHTLLRKEFWPWQGFTREIPEVVRKILVTLGGGDPDNVTLKVIEAIKLLSDPSLEVKVLVGPSNPHAETIRNAMLSAPCAMHCIENAEDMPELMAWADVGVAAAGSTAWELAFMGLPSVLLVLSENQHPVAEGLDSANVAVNIGWGHETNAAHISRVLDVLLRSREARSEMSIYGPLIVEGHGYKRVLNEIQGERVYLRPVQPEDCRLIWEWANDPINRMASFSSKLISWKMHCEWFENRLADPNCVFLIAENGNESPLGQIRYQIDGDSAVVSVSMAPNLRGRGYGSQFIREASKKILIERDAKTVHAYVKPHNDVSIRTFKKADFTSLGMMEIEGKEAIHFILKREKTG